MTEAVASTLDTAVDSFGWLAAELGLQLRLHTPADPADLRALAGLALRRNPRRPHLLVSRVLGKHIPVEPRVALDSGRRLADRVAAVLSGQPAPLVVGFAETATALGLAVRAGLDDAWGVHTTRRPAAPGQRVLAFTEDHSHAVDHRLLADPRLLAEPRPVVLADDELSTGRTVANAIRALHRLAPHPAYVLASLLDLRPGSERARTARLSEELGVPVYAVALLDGELTVPDEASHAAARWVREAAPPQSSAAIGGVERLRVPWPASLPLSAWHGWSAATEAAARQQAAVLADELSGRIHLDERERVLVLGCEELMYVPMLVAARLADGGRPVVYQSTTRSPIAALNRDGYAVRAAMTFPAVDDPGRASFLYNVRPGAYERVIVLTDAPLPAQTAGVLRAAAPVTVVELVSSEHAAWAANREIGQVSP